MYREEITDFLEEVKGEKIRMSSWSKDAYFIPDGECEYRPELSLVLMSGQYKVGRLPKMPIKLMISNGFDEDPYGRKWEYVGGKNDLEQS